MFRALKFIHLFRIIFGKRQLAISEIEKMGLLAVKIAQMYAVRSDLLGIKKCHQLQKLFEASSPIPWSEVKHVIDTSSSEQFRAAISTIEEAPLAAASLGQVHRAILMDGSEVVVKIIKPRAKHSFEADLRAVRMLAHLMTFFYPKLRRLADPIGTLDTISRLIRTELDLLNEKSGTRTLSQLAETTSDLPHLGKLSFPHIYTNLSTKNVLVSEYIPEKSVAKGLEDGTFRYEQLLQLFRTQGYYLFFKAEFHGDLHPGNIFFKEDQLWFIDNANIEKTDPNFTQGLLLFLGKLGAKDFCGAAHVMKTLSLTPPKNLEQYNKDFCQLYSDFESGKSSLTTKMMETVKLCVHSGMEFPEGAFPVIKSLMYLDGMALQCAPEANLLDDVLTFTSDLTPSSIITPTKRKPNLKESPQS